MDYEKMTVDSLAEYCFNRSGYAINKQDLMSRINNLILKDRAEQLRLHGVGSSLVADIRNKLTPANNLVAMLEDANAVETLRRYEPTKTGFIEKEMVNVKRSIEYLSNL